MKASTSCIFVLLLQVTVQPCMSVLFTVDAERTAYTAELGGQVVLGCRFSPKLSRPSAELKVTWRCTSCEQPQEVIRLDSRDEHSASPKYQRRVKLLMEELEDGWAKLQISNLTINDSGKYQCLVQTEVGTDYKTIALSVNAPYREVTTHVERRADDKVLLTCESEGYPKSPVLWRDGRSKSRPANTTATQTAGQLIRVTSRILVSSSEENNYTCQFKEGGHAAVFHLPDDIPTSHGGSDAVIIVLVCILMIVLLAGAAVAYYRRKGFRKSGGSACPADDLEAPLPADPCQQKDEKVKSIEMDLHEGLLSHGSDASPPFRE